MMPREWASPEMCPAEQVEVIEELAKANLGSECRGHRQLADHRHKGDRQLQLSRSRLVRSREVSDRYERPGAPPCCIVAQFQKFSAEGGWRLAWCSARRD
jgi:hypothetical protein